MGGCSTAGRCLTPGGDTPGGRSSPGPRLAAMAFQRCSPTWARGGGGPRGRSPISRIAGGGMAVGKVSGACSQCACSRHPEKSGSGSRRSRSGRSCGARQTRSTRRSGACASRLDTPSSRIGDVFWTSSRAGGAAAWTIPRASWRRRARGSRTCMTGDKRRAQRRMRHFCRIACEGMALGLCEGLVAGACSRGTVSRRPE